MGIDRRLTAATAAVVAATAASTSVAAASVATATAAAATSSTVRCLVDADGTTVKSGIISM